MRLPPTLQIVAPSNPTPTVQIVLPQNGGGMSSRDQPLQKGESPLRICSLSKEEFTISKDAKFSPGDQIIETLVLRLPIRVNFILKSK